MKPKRCASKRRRGGWFPPPDDGSHSIHYNEELDYVQDQDRQDEGRPKATGDSSR